MEDKPGGTDRGADTRFTDRAVLMDMVITTVSARVTGEEATAVGAYDRTEDKSGTGMHVGIKGNLPTLPTLKIDSVKSNETRIIAMKLGQSDSKEGGGLVWGKW